MAYMKDTEETAVGFRLPLFRDAGFRVSLCCGQISEYALGLVVTVAHAREEGSNLKP